MLRHLVRTSKHSTSMEHEPKSSPAAAPSAEFTTKARAWMSFGDSQKFLSSRVCLAFTTSRASSRFWLSWTQWQSCRIWKNQTHEDYAEKSSCLSGFRFTAHLRSGQSVAETPSSQEVQDQSLTLLDPGLDSLQTRRPGYLNQSRSAAGGRQTAHVQVQRVCEDRLLV